MSAEIPTPQEAIKPAEQMMLVGRFALASSHLLETGDIENLPDYAYHKIEGGIDELRKNSNSPDYVNAYLSEGISLAKNLAENGAQEQADDLLTDLTYQTLDGSGSFAEVVNKGELTDQVEYGLISLIAEGNSQNSGFNFLSGKKKYEFTVDVGEHERINTVKMLEMANSDPDRVNGLRVAKMYAEYLSNGISYKERSEVDNQNESLVIGIFESYGLSPDQAEEVFKVLSESGGDKYSVSLSERVTKSLGLLLELRANSADEEQYKTKLQKLYNKFGIRNFYRYTPEAMETQLDDGYIPDSVVVTAVFDHRSALANPSNSARGLEYEKPIYYEASDSLGIAKSLISAKRSMRKPLSKILIRAHGSPNGFVMSEDRKFGKVTTEQLDGRKGRVGWENEMLQRGIVDASAEVVFESCSLGAGGFPKSLYERTGIITNTAGSNIKGSGVEGSPGVLRVGDKIKFGTNDVEQGKRNIDEMTDSVSIDV